MDRDAALKLVEEKVTNKNIIKHMLATEAVMGELAKTLEPDEIEEWKMTSLLEVTMKLSFSRGESRSMREGHGYYKERIIPRVFEEVHGMD